MLYRYPSYCGKFRCIAGECKDNCCIGWEIGIDSETLAYYKSISGSFGKRLEIHIADDCFVLTEDERCPFLNSRNLCDIFTELGEEHLCQICTDHPRYYEWFGAVKEGGIGLCCEAAARIILSEDPVLTETMLPDEECDGCDEMLFRLLLSARELITEHLLHDPFPEAVCAMLEFAAELQERMDQGNDTLPAFRRSAQTGHADVQGMLHFFTTLEPISKTWIPYIERCAELADVIPRMQPEQVPFLRRIAVYFIFRYFMKGVFDGEILSRVRLAAVSTWVIGYLWRCGLYENGAFSFEEMAETARQYSKEVEYSAENLDSLADAFYEATCFDMPQLIGALEDSF